MTIVASLMALWLGLFGVVAACLVAQWVWPTVTGAARPIVWTARCLLFAALLYPIYEHGWFGAKLVEPSDSPGADAAMMFATVFLLELALSFDSVSLTLRLCRFHRVPADARPDILICAHAGMIAARVVAMIAIVHLVRAAPAVVYVLGFLTLWSVGTAFWDPDEPDKPLARMVKSPGALILSLVVADMSYAFGTTAISATKTTFIAVAGSVLAMIAQRSWTQLDRACRRRALRVPDRGVCPGRARRRQAAHP